MRPVTLRKPLDSRGPDPASTSLDVSPGPGKRNVRQQSGQLLDVPADWVLVPPGDPALTRRIKRAGPCWTVKEKRGRRTVSLGVWTAERTLQGISGDLLRERDDPAHARRLQAAKVRRDAAQLRYARDFQAAVLVFLAFSRPHGALADALASAITEHAIPVGSGTVARTKRIAIEQRAEAATIAWLRHQTTGYDGMHIPLARGQRRQVRASLAERSRKLLQRYRDGEAVPPERCPLRNALPGFKD